MFLRIFYLFALLTSFHANGIVIDLFKYCNLNTINNDDYTNESDFVVCENVPAPDFRDTIEFNPYIEKWITTEAIFRNCSFSNFPRSFFATFIGLNKLNMSFCNLRNLNSHDFSEAVQLTHLSLSYNDIEYLHPKLFEKAPNLKEINLSSNKITHLENDIFFGIQIRKFIGRHNFITKIDDHVFSTSFKLTLLDLSYNLLEAVHPNWFQNNDKLSELYLNNNRIKIFTSNSLGSANNLFTLDLSGNPLRELHSIPSFHLYVNNADLFSCTINNTYFHANNNELEQIYFDFPDRVIDLHLYKNKIKSMKSFVELQNIFGLDLSYNPLGSLGHRSFQKLHYLETLNLSNSNVYGLDYDTFWNLTLLATLDLSGNCLNTIEGHWLYPLRNLRELFVDGNNLSTFDYDDPGVTNHLRKIGLTNNSWDCRYLKRMITHFNSIHMEYILPEKHKPNSNKNIAGIGCT